MDDILCKPVIDLTEEERKQVLEFLNRKTPSVSFSRATLNDCERSEGLALDLKFIEPIAVPVPTLHIPDEIVRPVPSDFLCEHLLCIQKFFALNNEKSCRLLIDAILIEVLKSESNDKLFGFCKVRNDWEGTGFRYTGDVDYMLGSSKTKSVDTLDSFLMVVEAKKEWPDSAVPQVLAEAGCLLKKRLAAGKNTPVFAVLTNGSLFRFFAIDTDSVVHSSGLPPIGLGLGLDGTYKSSSSLSEILRWFTWFMTVIKSISPRASTENLTEESIENSLSQLKNCFGSKSKKARIQS